MGFLDDVRRAKQAAKSQPEGLSKKERIERAKEQLAAEDREAYEDRWLAPGAERPYIELIDVVGRAGSRAGDFGWRPWPVEAYLMVVGLHPEDCFGVWPTRSGETGVYEVAIAYRERPEYAAGRQRYEQWLAEQ